MTKIQDLIDIATSLCKTLDAAASNERQFCVDVQLRFEQLSYESLRMADELTELRNYVGVG